MSKQKISGILHNCSLYATLPILLDGIKSLAEHEKNNTIDTIKENTVVSAYVLLKQKFAEYYEVEPNILTFEMLNAFLEKYNFYAKELIFSPVLRQFVHQKAVEENYGNPQHYSELQENGNYIDLAFAEAHDLFYTHFGILHEQYTFTSDKKTNDPQDNYSSFIPAFKKSNDYPFGEQPTIKLYQKHDHYELQPHERLKEAAKTYNQEVEILPDYLDQAHQSITFSNSTYDTQIALKNTKQPITRELKIVIKLYTDVNTIVHQGTKYHIQRMAQMVSQFEYEGKDNSNSFLNARKRGDSPEATAKNGRFFEPRRARRDQIKKLHDAAATLLNLYNNQGTAKEIEQAGAQLIELVLQTQTTISKEWNRKTSNLSTNLKQVLNIAKTAVQDEKTVVQELEKTQSIYLQMMFKTALDDVKQENTTFPEVLPPNK